jgi:hypothetical protein
MLNDGDPILMIQLNHQKDDTHQNWKQKLQILKTSYYFVGPLVAQF